MDNCKYVLKLVNRDITLVVNSQTKEKFFVIYLISFIAKQHTKGNHIKLNLILKDKDNTDFSDPFRQSHRYFGYIKTGTDIWYYDSY